jgi:hypothetical protein
LSSKPFRCRLFAADPSHVSNVSVVTNVMHSATCSSLFCSQMAAKASLTYHLNHQKNQWFKSDLLHRMDMVRLHLSHI